MNLDALSILFIVVFVLLSFVFLWLGRGAWRGRARTGITPVFASAFGFGACYTGIFLLLERL